MAKSLQLFLVSILVSAGSHATCTDQNNTGYTSIESAAAAAGRRYFGTSALEDREFMGGILQRGSSYHFTVTAGVPGEDEIETRIPVPADSTLIGFWHTHGSPHYSRRYFSDLDTQLVESMGVPFYLTDPDGTLRVFRPGDKTMNRFQSRKLGLGGHRGFARGNRVRVKEVC